MISLPFKGAQKYETVQPAVRWDTPIAGEQYAVPYKHLRKGGTMADLLGNIGESAQDVIKGRFLTFLIGKETFGMDIRHVTEIIGVQPITSMPDMPEYIRGIINLRGCIIPIMDVGLRLKMPRRDYDDKTCVIVTDFNNITFGLVVDSVSEVVTIPDENVLKKPDIGFSGSRGYVGSIGKIGDAFILLIDCGSLFGEDEPDAVCARPI